MTETLGAVLHSLGDVPRLEAIPPPARSPGQTLISVAAASLNPADLAMASGYLPGGMPPPPLTVGLEGAGRVVSSDLYAEGTPVWFQSMGAFAALAVAPDDRVSVLPADADLAISAALGIAGFAALAGLERAARLRRGEAVLVLGASGAVGCIGIQVARILGASPVIAAGRDAGTLERARAIGADGTALLAPDGDWAEALRAAVVRAAGRPRGFDVVLDPVWGDAAAAATMAMAPGGRLVTMGTAAPATFGPQICAGALEIIGFDGGRWPARAWTETVARLAGWVSERKLTLHVQRLPLTEVAKAYELQAATPRRKIVLIP
jgi:NADPH:quinone reductase-like Zn-dependent oxidoreductase